MEMVHGFPSFLPFWRFVLRGFLAAGVCYLAMSGSIHGLGNEFSWVMMDMRKQDLGEIG